MRAVKPFTQAYPAPWRIQDREIVDRDGCNVQDINDSDPDEYEFWRGIVAAVNAHADDGFNPYGSGPVPIGPRDNAVTFVLDHNRPLRVRHVKRGSEYEVVGQASLQSSVAVSEGINLVVYRDERGLLWARPSAEFSDGRFVKIEPREA